MPFSTPLLVDDIALQLRKIEHLVYFIVFFAQPYVLIDMVLIYFRRYWQVFIPDAKLIDGLLFEV